jgi:hypothetical protein
MTVTVLGRALSATAEGCSSRFHGVDRVGLAVQPAGLAIGAIDLDHPDTPATQVAGQSRAVGARTLHPDPGDGTKPGHPVEQRLVPSGAGRERSNVQHPPLPSTTAAVCSSRCVSTPPVTGRISTLVIAIPSLSKSSRGGTHVPGRRSCAVRLRQQPDRSPSGTGRAASGAARPTRTHRSVPHKSDRTGGQTVASNPARPVDPATRTTLASITGNCLTDVERW